MAAARKREALKRQLQQLHDKIEAQKNEQARKATIASPWRIAAEAQRTARELEEQRDKDHSDEQKRTQQAAIKRYNSVLESRNEKRCRIHEDSGSCGCAPTAPLLTLALAEPVHV